MRGIETDFRTWTIVPAASPDRIDRSLEGIRRVCPDAFDEVDADDVEQRRSNSLAGHRAYSGFRLDLALDGYDDVIGFVYGYLSAPDQPRHDRVARALVGVGLDAWLDDAFEIVELGVAQTWRGRGIGGMLHDSILADVPERRALLWTPCGATPVREMYERRKWRVLLEPFHFRSGDQGFAIMGLDLDAYRPSARR